MRTVFLLSLVLVVCIHALPVRAGVDQVILFPDGCQITQTESASVSKAGADLWEAVLHLPSSADPDSLRIHPLKIPEASIQNIGHTQVRAHDSKRIAELKKQLRELSATRDGISAALTGITSRIQLWENAVRTVPETEPRLEDLHNLSASLEQVLPSLNRDKSAKTAQLKEVKANIAEVQKELEQSMDNPDTQLEVRVLLAAPDLAAGQELPVTISYHAKHSRWRPAYTLEALPDKNEVHFRWQAEIVQKSGRVWNDAPLQISTGRMQQRVTPPDLRDWIIQPRPQPRPLAEKAGRMQTMDAAVAGAASRNDAVQSGYETYDLWDVGRQTVYPGREQLIPITRAVWSARFERILRPAVDSRAYLRADVSAEEAQHIPAGKAMYLVQGRTVGTREFSFTGQDAELSFGPDPQVTGTRILEAKKEGEQGILKNKQKMSWSYRFDLENGKDRAVQVRLEETRPQSRHDDIDIELASPGHEFHPQDNRIIWELELKAGEKRSVPLQVTVTAPPDMDLISPR
ncbi:DUF4139 domain-containing protein [Desulfovermiculus halophilus]|uniref:DUF4139 domain-containing protein n=1 Tax=Desulfovermiculus halophilus TaxID=339722 RepID=UPI0004823F28|nr:DUF4139 domain-containing protein [Desulfovermiculus halophilus]